MNPAWEDARREERQWKMDRSWTLRDPDDDTPSAYENRNRAAYLASNGKLGMRIPLGRGVFWSRGWSGCPQCGGDVTTHRANKLYMTDTAIGWSCNGKPGKWED